MTPATWHSTAQYRSILQLIVVLDQL